MRYQDFSPEDQQIIDEFLSNYNEQRESDPYGYIELYPEELQDDEIFFRTADEVKDVMQEWLESPGPYGIMARELFEYFDGTEWEDEDMQPRHLEKGNWAYVARVGDGRYLFMSNSWSDSGLFLNRK